MKSIPNSLAIVVKCELRTMAALQDVSFPSPAKGCSSKQ